MKKIFLFFLLILLVVPIVNAVPPFAESFDFDEGVQIYTPIQYYFEQDTAHTFRFQVLNGSNGFLFQNDTTNCSLNIIDDEGSILYDKSKVGYDGTSWAITLNKGNFSEIGHYNYGIRCYVIEGFGGIKPTEYEVTPSGKELRTSESLIYLGSLLLLIVFLVLCVVGISKYEKVYMRLLLGYCSYLLLVAINYVAWITTKNMFAAPTLLPRIFYWVWTILVYAFIPILFGSLLFYFYMLYKSVKLDNMLKHGVPEDRALMSEFGRGKGKTW